MFPETVTERACFPNVSHFCHTGKNCFQRQFLFPRCKLCFLYTTENFNDNPSMRAVVKILRAHASEQLSNFCEQFEQRPNFASTFNFNGIIRYPF